MDIKCRLNLRLSAEMTFLVQFEVVLAFRLLIFLRIAGNCFISNRDVFSYELGFRDAPAALQVW